MHYDWSPHNKALLQSKGIPGMVTEPLSPGPIRQAGERTGRCGHLKGLSCDTGPLTRGHPAGRWTKGTGDCNHILVQYSMFNNITTSAPVTRNYVLL